MRPDGRSKQTELAEAADRRKERAVTPDAEQYLNWLAQRRRKRRRRTMRIALAVASSVAGAMGFVVSVSMVRGPDAGPQAALNSPSAAIGSAAPSRPVERDSVAALPE